MLVKGYKRGEAFDLEVGKIGGDLYLSVPAADAYLRMCKSAKEDGITLSANTAFRTMEHQTRLFKQYIKDLADFNNSKRATKPAPVAQPGRSNHQSGIAVDINRAVGDNLSTKEPDSPTDLWLKENAQLFNFKRTVAVEPWHWEYLPNA